jgi:hypothetical protein
MVPIDPTIVRNGSQRIPTDPNGSQRIAPAPARSTQLQPDLGAFSRNAHASDLILLDPVRSSARSSEDDGTRIRAQAQRGLESLILSHTEMGSAGAASLGRLLKSGRCVSWDH